MPGEHWCSVCETELRKREDTYTKIYWRNWLTPKSETISLVCPKCEEEDKELHGHLQSLVKYARKPPRVGRFKICSICGNEVKDKERHLKIEWYEDGKEKWAKFCKNCAKDFESLRVAGKNPSFKVAIQCLSAPNCSSFTAPKKERGVNCLHVVVNMDGVLYCRRAHPGHLRLYREKYAFPPTVRRLREMLKNLQIFFTYLNARYNFASVEDARQRGKEERIMAEKALEELNKLFEEKLEQAKV